MYSSDAGFVPLAALARLFLSKQEMDRRERGRYKVSKVNLDGALGVKSGSSVAVSSLPVGTKPLAPTLPGRGNLANPKVNRFENAKVIDMPVEKVGAVDVKKPKPCTCCSRWSRKKKIVAGCCAFWSIFWIGLIAGLISFRTPRFEADIETIDVVDLDLGNLAGRIEFELVLFNDNFAETTVLDLDSQAIFGDIVIEVNLAS